LLGSIGSVIQGLASGWGAYTNSSLWSCGVWWNPFHLFFYSGFAIVITAICQGFNVRSRPPPLSPVQFVNLDGLKLAIVGLGIQIVAEIWNEVTNHFANYESNVFLSKAILIVGMLTIDLGMLVGLSIEHGMIKRHILVVNHRRIALTFIFLVIDFASIWINMVGPFLFTVQFALSSVVRLFLGVLIAIMATVVLVPAKKVLPHVGSACLVSGVFNLFGLIVALSYLGNRAYVPIGVLSGLGFDLLLVAIGMKFRQSQGMIIASAIFGSLFCVTYYPYAINLFPWKFYPLLMASLMLGSMSGAVIGMKIYSVVSGTVLGDTATHTSR
jgi:hypothetical protein